MDVRIGLIQNAKELEVQLDDDADAGGAPGAGATPPSRTAAPSGSPTARAARWAWPPRSSPTSRSAAPTTAAASASGADGRFVPVDLLDRQLLFVTGKGGVGKTTIAASLALLASQHGKRTLVGEVDAKGNLADFFEIGPTSFKEREVAPGLFAMSMDTEESLKEYLSLQLKIPLVARLGPLARTFDFVANAAPGVKEILTIGKFLWEVRERSYDLVVVDAVATGHIIGQLAAPAGDPGARAGGHGARPDRLDARHARRPRADRRRDRGGARGDAGERDPRAGRAADAARPSSTSPPSS